MTRLEHLLTCLAEECAEVAQRSTKALRFGIDEVQPGQFLTNAERIREEVVDLFAVLGMLEEETGWSLLPNDIDGGRDKRKKVEAFLRYSAEVGTLSAGREEIER